MDIANHMRCFFAMQVTSCNPFLSSMVGASTLRQIIAYGGAQLLSKGGAFARDSIDAESEIIGAAILNHFSTQMATRNNTSEEGEEDEGMLSEGGTYLAFVNWNKLKELVQSFFPSCNLSAAKSNTRVPKELLEAIKTQLKERHLQCLPSLLEKVCTCRPKSMYMGIGEASVGAKMSILNRHIEI